VRCILSGRLDNATCRVEGEIMKYSEFKVRLRDIY
jgi:hypothetical protein